MLICQLSGILSDELEKAIMIIYLFMEFLTNTVGDIQYNKKVKSAKKNPIKIRQLNKKR